MKSLRALQVVARVQLATATSLLPASYANRWVISRGNVEREGRHTYSRFVCREPFRCLHGYGRLAVTERATHRRFPRRFGQRGGLFHPCRELRLVPIRGGGVDVEEVRERIGWRGDAGCGFVVRY